MSGWDFSSVFQNFNLFLPAAWMTLKVTAAGVAIGLILGLMIALLRVSKHPALNAPAKAYIWIIRGTPLLLQLWIIYLGLGSYIFLDRFPSTALALGIHNGAYIAEIFRGAIESIGRGQREAGTSLGMTRWTVMRRIILPQAFKIAIPPLGNQLIIALKDSSLASTIAVHELMLTAKQLGSSSYRYLEYLTVAALFYLIITSLLTIVLKRVENRMKISTRRA